MIRLYDYPGFAEDSIKREVDIRLRNTDGRCEIMVKRKASDDNMARHEHSLKLVDTDLETAKQTLKALGYAKGLWMHRKKDVYQYQNVEWSLVEAPKKIFYFEAEQEVADAVDIKKAEKHLRAGAAILDLSVYTPDEYREFVAMLGREVNKVIEW